MNLKPLLKLFLRMVCYSVTMLLILEAIEYDASHGVRGAKYTESGFTEISQVVFLFLGGALALLFAFQKNRYKHFLIGASTFFFISFFREFNNYITQHFLDGAWKILVYATLIPFFIYMVRKNNWKKLLEDLVQLCDSFPLGVMVVGFIIVFLFSRIYGLHGIWIDILGDDYIRDIKNVSEEGTELLGYAFMFLGLAEIAIWSRKNIVA